jgi:DNA-directed RNA polymerase specialized sigma subunit
MEYLNNKSFEKIICRFQEIKKERQKHDLLMADIKGTELRTAKRNRYQKPEAWTALQEIAYNTIVAQFDAAQQDLAAAFYTLSENIVKYAKFNLIDEDDAIQEGVLICFEKIDRFDPSKGKAFNYMTTCILNHFRQLYRTAKNYNDLKKRYHDFIQSQIQIVNRPGPLKNKHINNNSRT